MNYNEIIIGDALEELPKLESSIAQAIIADPPYYNVLLNESWDTQWSKAEEYIEWSKVWVSQAMRILKDDGLFFCFGQLGKREHVFIHLMSELCMRYQFHDLIIWDRAVGYNERRDSFTPAYEMILVLRKSAHPKFNKDAVREPYDKKTIQAYLRDKRYKDKNARLNHLINGKYATNILRVPSLKGSSKEKCGHPSQKPLNLISKLVLSSTDPGDIVLDPFIGSGTTAEACLMNKRKYIGIEINVEYKSIIEKRLNKFRLEKSLFASEKERKAQQEKNAPTPSKQAKREIREIEKQPKLL